MQHEEDSLALGGGEDQQIQDSLVHQDHDMNREDDRERERNDQHDHHSGDNGIPTGPRSAPAAQVSK